jgi:hypothetical protein
LRWAPVERALKLIGHEDVLAAAAPHDACRTTSRDGTAAGTGIAEGRVC